MSFTFAIASWPWEERLVAAPASPGMYVPYVVLAVILLSITTTGGSIG